MIWQRELLPSGWRTGDLIADHAGIVGPAPISCVLCHTMIWHGQRAAQLADGTGDCHVSCLPGLKPARPA
jgi:hypothetical protein